MTLMQIRDVPDDVHRTLKARAAARGISLNGYLIDLVVRDAARSPVEEVLARALARAERAETSSVAGIRAERDAR
jgi:antitoxin FitA